MGCKATGFNGLLVGIGNLGESFQKEVPRSFSITCFEPPEAVCLLPVLLRAVCSSSGDGLHVWHC